MSTLNEPLTFAFCPEHYKPFSSAVPNASGLPGDHCPECGRALVAGHPEDAFLYQRRKQSRLKELIGLGRDNEDLLLIDLLAASMGTTY